MSEATTASQTIGPYSSIGFTWLNTDNLAVAGVEGDRITLEGRIVDGDGTPVADAVVEIWQANRHGRYPHPEDRGTAPLEPEFTGFGRVPTDAEGRFRFTTIKPGRVPAPGGGWQAPHVNVTILMRGMLRHLMTRIYFSDERANAEDPVLARVPSARRDTLVARVDPAKPSTYVFDVRLQGDGETVFFDV